MRKEMAEAEVGDDVYGEDLTVNRLESMVAKLMGKERGLFCASGTQSNLLALMSHCQRGDEYIVGQTAHTYKYEGGGAAVLGSIQPQPLEFEADGTLDLERVQAVIKPDDAHFARTRLFCLENTQGGKVIPMAYLKAAGEVAKRYGLAFHLDGARIFNAAVKLGISAQAIADPFDSVSVCLSKGLGAPVGSVLCGSQALIQEARKWRKMVGGGMRQAGIVAAGGIYALEHNVQRLANDHGNAETLAHGLSKIDGIQVLPESAQTNMVFIQTGKRGEGLQRFMQERNILISGDDNLRLVTHLNINTQDIERVVEAFHRFFEAS